MGLSGGAHEVNEEAAALNASGTEMRRLWAEGVTGSAVITASSDTGARLAGNVVLQVQLRVTREGREPYVAVLRLPIAGTDTGPYRPGCVYTVKIDPRDPQKLTFAA